MNWGFIRTEFFEIFPWKIEGNGRNDCYFCPRALDKIKMTLLANFHAFLAFGKMDVRHGTAHFGTGHFSRGIFISVYFFSYSLYGIEDPV